MRVGNEACGWVAITFWRVLNVIRPMTCEFDSVVSGWKSRVLKQPSSSDYSTHVYDIEALAQAHRSMAQKPPRAVSLCSTSSSKEHVALCPMMQALGE